MHSFLISSKDKNKLIDEYKKICRNEKIDKFDISLIESEKTIGIPDVRSAQNKIFLKPFKSTQKAVIFNAFSGITVEAQNALLKTLEEPPANTIIILLTDNVDEILPTVISRCKVLILDKSLQPADDEKEIYQKLFKDIQKITVGEKLKLAQDFGKTKEQAGIFCRNLILVIRENMLMEEKGRRENVKILKEFEKTYKTLKTTNANQRLTLENLLFSI
jgi:hypothetical protein